MQYIWLVPLLPGLGAAVNGLVGVRSFSRKTAGVVALTFGPPQAGQACGRAQLEGLRLLAPRGLQRALEARLHLLRANH